MIDCASVAPSQCQCCKVEGYPQIELATIEADLWAYDDAHVMIYDYLEAGPTTCDDASQNCGTVNDCCGYCIAYYQYDDMYWGCTGDSCGLDCAPYTQSCGLDCAPYTQSDLNQYHCLYGSFDTWEDGGNTYGTFYVDREKDCPDPNDLMP